MVTDAEVVTALPTSQTCSAIYRLQNAAISSIQVLKKTRNLLISDSKGKGFNMTNFDILSLPGANVEPVYNFITKKYFYDIIVLFIGGNNLFTVTSEDLARQVSDLQSSVKGGEKGYCTRYTFRQLST